MVYATKSAFKKTNKQKNQHCSEGASMAARCMRGGNNQALGRKEKTNTWADSKYFYTEESEP